jgi:hypothetical protein
MRAIGRSAGLLVSTVAIVAIAGNVQTQAPPSSSAALSRLKQVAYIKASNTSAGDHFGSGGSDTEYSGNALAISSDGNTMAVGAPLESSNAKGINGDQSDRSVPGAGAVYVFTRKGNDWVQQAYIKASNPRRSSRFGSTIALSADGNTMAVAAHWESSAATGINGNQNDDSIPQAGAVYIFTRAGTMWSQQAYVKASNTGEPDNGIGVADGDQFGYSLALSADGNTLAVGAISEDSAAKGVNGNQEDDSVPESGAAYVFTRTGQTWKQQAYLKASNTSRNDLFGYSMGISTDGNTLAVAGYNEGSNSRQVNGDQNNKLAPGSGAIYVFVRSAGLWKQTDYIKGSRSERNDALGYSLALSEDGNTIVAGAGEESCPTPGVNPPGCDNDSAHGSTSIGAAYVFFRTGTAWAEQAFIKASNPKIEDWFGVRSAISGDGNTIAVSAPVQDGGAKGINGDQNDLSATDSGAVYLFTRSGGTWTQRAYIKASNTHAYDEFGSSIALNRDGKILAVGAHKESSGAKGINGDQNDHSAPDSGAVYLFMDR